MPNERRLKAKIELIEKTAEDVRPNMAVYIVDRGLKIIEKIPVSEAGDFDFPEALPREAARVILGPLAENLEEIPREEQIAWRAADFVSIVRDKKLLELAKRDWSKWLYRKYCVSGHIKKCYPVFCDFPPLFETPKQFKKAKAPDAAKEMLDLSKLLPENLGKCFRRCKTICEGSVEVYRRTCCCPPFIVYDPRIPGIIAELEKKVARIPDINDIQWPPRPEPDPFPLEKLPFYQDGVLDMTMINARQDLSMLRKLLPHEQVEYLKPRHYLWCGCSRPVKVAEGFIRGAGEFHVCWSERLRLMLIHCHDEYSFIIKQNIDGDTVTIYNGLKAHKWHHYGDHANLITYCRKAITCSHAEFEGTGAFAVLDSIGSTPSYRLHTPNATGWDRVAAPGAADGLVDVEAIGPNCNWGGGLSLLYHFAEDMRLIGAKYYRVSAVRTNGGAPIGTRHYLAPGLWQYWEKAGADIVQKSIALGPHTVGSQENLYDIPYDFDREWRDLQYHAYLDTTNLALFPEGAGRYLITLEVFNAAGQLLRPMASPDPGGSMAANFTYRRWTQPDWVTQNVPFAGLTHMIWWDNQAAVADIVDLRLNGVQNTAQCQFISETPPNPNSEFSTGYRAYHPDPLFLWKHELWWSRGLNGDTGVLTTPYPSTANVGVLPNPPQESDRKKFSVMLHDSVSGVNFPKCTFSVNLHVHVKTWNGSVRLDYLDRYDQASFALQQS